MSGIAAILQLPSACQNSGSAATKLKLLIQQLANRGQSGFGLVALSRRGHFQVRQSKQSAYDLVSCTLCWPSIKKAGLAHIHNARDMKQDPQPFCGDHVAVTLDGVIINGDELRCSLEQSGVHFDGISSAELLVRLIESYIQPNVPPDYTELLKQIDAQIDGAASAVIMDKHGKMVAYRNKNGLRPLHYGRSNDGFMLFASENHAFAGFDGIKEGEILPSHIKIADMNTGVCEDRFVGDARHAAKLCAYETIYLANPKSKIRGRSYDDVRYALGQAVGDRIAGKLGDIDPESVLVASMPETGRPYADGVYDALVRQLGFEVERREIIELQSQSRTLGLGSQRKSLIEQKYHLARGSLLGRNLVIADEALIYGDTSSAITSLLHQDTGMRSIHWAIGSSPIVAPNYYGMGIKRMDDLAFWQVWPSLPDQLQQKVLGFNQMPIETLGALESHMARYIGADSLTYVPFDHLIEIIPNGATHNDLSAFTLQMPTAYGQRLAESNLKRLTRGLG